MGNGRGAWVTKQRQRQKDNIQWRGTCVRHCCRLPYRLSYDDDTVKCATCRMQHAPARAPLSTPYYPFPSPSLHCRHCCSLCCAVHLLQTLILFMLQCSEVNNFIYPLPEARTMRASLQLHSLVAGCLPLKLQLRMTHDTCLGCEKLFHLLPCQDLLKAMASSAD